MLDTTEEILNIQRQIFRNKTSEQRFLIGNELINFGQFLVENSIKQQNSNISEIDLKIEVFKRYYTGTFDSKQLEIIIKLMTDYFNDKNPK